MRVLQLFNLKRLFLLIKKDFCTRYKTFLLATGAGLSVLFIIHLMSIGGGQSWDLNVLFYPLILFIGGFVFTSFSFYELRQVQSRSFYLCIPASNLEKFVSQLFISSLGYVFLSLLIYFLFSLIVYSLTVLIFGASPKIFNPFEPDVWLVIRVYMSTQSIFLLGSIYFKENALMKTILSLFGFFIVCIAFMVGVIYFFDKISIHGRQVLFSSQVFQMSLESFNYSSLSNFINVMGYGLKLFFWFLMAPLFWIVSYFRLKELEV